MYKLHYIFIRFILFYCFIFYIDRVVCYMFVINTHKKKITFMFKIKKKIQNLIFVNILIINHYDNQNIKIKRFYMDLHLKTLFKQFWRIYRKDIKNGKYFITINNYKKIIKQK